MKFVLSLFLALLLIILSKPALLQSKRSWKPSMEILKERCISCELCIPECPAKAIYRDATGRIRINRKKCIGCSKCWKVCPQSAIIVRSLILFLHKK